MYIIDKIQKKEKIMVGNTQNSWKFDKYEKL